MKGKLFLLPVPITENGIHTLPEAVIDRMHAIRYFIAENARTTRRFLSSTQPPWPIREVSVQQFGKHDDATPDTLLAPLKDGHDVAFMSEAGCPGIADPGSRLVAWAHENGFKVVPMSGPSSILLALMASGANGQSFCFNGYLPRDKKRLDKHLKELEHRSRRNGTTQIFMETPYRNTQMLGALFQALTPSTRLTIAADITGPKEFIRTLTIERWRATGPPKLHKVPAIFIIEAQ